MNVKGLNSPIKRKKIFNKLVKEQGDIICLQETHIKERDYRLLKHSKLGKLYYAADKERKKKGITIYIKQNIYSKLIKSDEEGRLLMVETQINQKKTLVIGIYAPNDKQETFYRKLYKEPIIREYENICLVGDFNGIADTRLDHKKERNNFFKKRRTLPKVFFQMVEELNLRDLW